MTKTFLILSILLILVFNINSFSQSNETNSDANISNVDALKDTLSAIASRTNNDMLALSCESMLLLIDSELELSVSETGYLDETYQVFLNGEDEGSPKNFESYLTRQRSFIIAWQSPTDGEVSFTWLKLPENWDPEIEYPLYVQLHGLWDVAANAIDYMTYPFRYDPSSTYAFDDGYHISPWGRGNFWYEGISETDIWECIDVIEDLVKIKQDKKFLCGHSMGGYGAWNLGQKTSEIWAALGIHAGALWYGNRHLVTDEVTENLRNTPVYFVCGDSDQLLGVNREVYTMLDDMGNNDIEFVTFPGGHDYHSEDVEAMYDWMSGFVLTVKEQAELIEKYDLLIGPNPFNDVTKISFNLNKSESVKIEVYDNMGQLVEIVANKKLKAGFHSIAWQQNELGQGIYFCQVQFEKQKVNQRVIVY
ncbi:MAG: T9SS type A sorting domain-containing protein [Salinivirgaceae bacterium]|jgi:predicted esterase|nr:T9SS type A sorting domain-containing protein [Salinivirgaceae bacterium]